MKTDPRLQKLAAANDRMSQNDRRFFVRFPHRKHRIRVAHSAEIEAAAIIDSAEGKRLPQGFCFYVVTKSLAPNVRLRASFIGIEGADTDITEEMARAIFEAVKIDQPKIASVEAQFYAAHTAEGSPK